MTKDSTRGNEKEEVDMLPKPFALASGTVGTKFQFLFLVIDKLVNDELVFMAIQGSFAVRVFLQPKAIATLKCFASSGLVSTF
jgi:hypothetical protein